MQVRLLGPVEVVVDGDAVPIGGPKQRAVLAILGLSANRVVAVDRIVAGVWGDDAVARSPATLQVYVSNLRKALPRDVIVSRRPGYLLSLPPDDLDTAVFERLAREGHAALEAGRPAQAATALHGALRLWRGQPFADLREFPFAPADVVRLQQARLAAVEDRVDADLALGRHHDLVHELEGLVAEHPLRERLWGQLIVSLYRSDRQADALATYRRARDLLADELGIDPGPALRDLERAVLAQDLDVVAPAARTVSLVPTRIPVPGSSFVGRDTELSTIVDLLVRDGERLVTLSGPGGCGKTRVAIELARRVAAVFRGGTYFVDLSAVEHAAAVPAVVARAIGIPDADTVVDEQTVADAFLDRESLLILDNFEQLLAAAPFVTSVLRSAPGLRVVVTSRTALRVTGETDVQLPGLALPRAGDPWTTIAGSEAVVLFQARARATRTGFTVDAVNASLVADICVRLEGLPLAVELAAARLRVMTIGEVHTRLDDTLGLLVTGPRDVPARQRTLRATIDWSIALLSDDDRAVLREISVFVGQFSLDAARAVAGPAAEAAVESLVDSSLVRVVTTGAHTRFRLPDPIRQYVHEQGQASDEVLGRFVRHFVAAADRARGALDGPEASVVRGELDVEYRNYSEAMDVGDPDSVAAIACALVPYWIVRGAVTEGRRRLRAVLGSRASAEWVAAARIAGGRLAYHQGDLTEARSLLSTTDSVEVREEDRLMARCLLAAVDITSGDMATGIAAAEDVLRIATTEAHYAPRVMALSVLAIASAMSGRFDAERDLYENRLELCRRHGDRVRVADTLTTLAEIAFDAGDIEGATTLVREAFDIADGHSRPESRDALILSGRLALTERDVDRADEVLNEALLRAVDIAQPGPLALCVRALAACAAVRGDLVQAARLFGAGGAGAGAPGVEQDIAVRRAECLERLGDHVYEREARAGAALTPTEVLDLAARPQRAGSIAAA